VSIRLVVCALLVILTLLTAGCGDDSSNGSGTSSSSTPNIVDLHASVKINSLLGTLQITNKDSTAWNDTQVCLNAPSGLTLDKGYTLKVGNMAPGETKTVANSQFAKSDGTIFNSDTTKVMSVEIDTLDSQGMTTGLASFDASN